MTHFQPGRVHFRTPTYKRPDALRRALQSMIDQTSPDWVCDVYDDDPAQAGQEVVKSLSDPRIHYTANAPQLFASRNIDQCFTANNPRGAEYFCVVEDDNFLLADFCADNIALARTEGVDIILRNQLIEHASATANARLGSVGVLDDLFSEGRFTAEEFRLALLAGIGVSNGGLFWSARARSQLEIQFSCTATLQEYLRTYSIVEPVYVAMQPQAVWAENAERTTRNAELTAGYYRRELDLKRAVQELRQMVWTQSSAEQRATFMTNPRFVTPTATRAVHVGKALLDQRLAKHVSPLQALRLRTRGLMIRSLGRLTPEFHQFIASRNDRSVHPA